MPEHNFDRPMLDEEIEIIGQRLAKSYDPDLDRLLVEVTRLRNKVAGCPYCREEDTSVPAIRARLIREAGIVGEPCFSRHYYDDLSGTLARCVLCHQPHNFSMHL